MDDEHVQFRKDCFDEHNEVRRIHGADELKLAKFWRKVAQEYAEKLAMDDPCARGKSPKHSESDPDFARKLRSKADRGKRIGYGEHLVRQGNFKEKEERKKKKIIKDVSGQYVVKPWYSEKANYISHTIRTGEYRHFTQVVWKGSKKIGVGKAKFKEGRTYVVVMYHPRGNIIGQYEENVSTLRHSMTKTISFKFSSF